MPRRGFSTEVKISVIGLGKLGAPLAVVLASKGFDVVGADLNQAPVDAITSRISPVDEPDLQELIDGSGARLTATVSVTEAVTMTDVTFVVVPTPSDSHGRFSNAAILASTADIGAGVKRKDGYHVVFITSTVMPGSTGGEIREALERHSGRTVGRDLGLCYGPEFVALGSVVRDLLRPDMILIGESDARAGDALEAIHIRVCENQPAIRRMNFVNAELTKISVNTFVTTKITYANMLADICDRLPEANVDVVTQAVGSDSRIGVKYLRGAVGYGGPCFPRDNIALATLGRSLGARAELAEATDTLNRYQIERVLGIIGTRRPDSGIVGVLGLSYKPNTAVVEESQGLLLVGRLLDLGQSVLVYDPKAIPAAQAALRRPFGIASSASDCVRAASLVVVMTPWPEFQHIPRDAFSRSPGRLIVVDCWRMMPISLASVADVVNLGQGAALAPR